MEENLKGLCWLSKIRLSISALLVVFVSAACNRNFETFPTQDYTIVEGRVLDVATLEPIEGAKVTLYADPKNLPEAEYMVVYSDSNGHYSFRWNHDQKTHYEIATRANGYWSNYHVTSFPDIYELGRPNGMFYVNRGRDIIHDELLAPKGWIQFHFVNQTNKVNFIDVSNNLDIGGPFIGFNVNAFTAYDLLFGGTLNRIYFYYGYQTDSIVFKDIFIPSKDSITYVFTY